MSDAIVRLLAGDKLEAMQKEIERLRADLKNAADDREACLMFLRTELMWEEFREEFMGRTASGENAKKLMEFLRRFEKPKTGGDDE